MTRTRPTAVAGRFYPADRAELEEQVRAHLSRGDTQKPAPRAVIAPHAGYVYSGDVAGRAFAPIESAADTIRRVVLVGPSHYVGFDGLAISSADAFETPLGEVPVDTELRRQLVDAGLAQVLDEPHTREHSLETHLPFLQGVLGSFELLPVAVGRATGAQVADLLEEVWDDDETFISVSSDLSHFHPYDEARDIDRRTCQAIEELRPDDLSHGDACGRIGIQGLLEVAKRRGLRVETLDLRNSGDTAGPKNEVVGYGAWAVYA
ncbi:AmmeMemoRadiSam system protein B [Persicimonas caeni]|uniref:MEMO1 family protein FIV42_05830 n=1 Tax=Persicimonas caeni TaxID=2292766 RepID=A0A4Y6PPJ2_PERCE|nr:AmmeMemoRadiSam system protein B [Persicimonas caeni]QDG50266.1 AmmeMemoRadiSam system protein B [Persicimonas caeni]QED31487.1 AmmeMemoRadiSam system protein B [Persicimonas caeni]